LQEFLPKATRSSQALDLGGGTGEIAVRLARLGLHVTLLDTSQPMLDFAKRAAREAGVADKDCPETRRCRAIVNLVPGRII